jgi:hypothetical protein
LEKNTKELEKQAEAEKARNEAEKQRLTDAKTLADGRLSITKAGSKAELDARIADINAAAAADLNTYRDNAEMKKIISQKTTQDIAAAKKSFYQKVNEEAKAGEEKKSADALRRVDDEKAAIEAKLILLRQGHDDEQTMAQKQYDLNMQLEAKERERIAADTGMANGQKEKAFAEINEKELELKTSLHARLEEIDKAHADKEAAIKKAAADKEVAAIAAADKAGLSSQITTANEALSKEKENSDQYVAIKKNILALQQQMALDAASTSIAGETQRLKTIEDINEDYAKKQKQIDDDVAKHKQELKDKEAAQAKDTSDKEMAIAKKAGQEAIKIAQQVSDAIFANAQQRRDNELKATEDNLDAQKNAELLNTTLTASQRNAIEKKYKAEEANAKLQAWKADQKAKEEQAIINGLLAFTAALASSPPPMNYVNAAIALASAGVQAGIIASKTPPKFARGTKGSATLPAGMKLVGEEGPELLWTPGGEKVITAPDTARFLEAYNIPMLSTFPRIDIKDMAALKVSPFGGDVEGAGRMDYDSLGRALARHLPAPVVNSIQLNEKGFIKHLTRRGNSTEYVNNYIKF